MTRSLASRAASRIQPAHAALSLIAAVMVAGCGGGGGDADVSAPNAADTTAKMSTQAADSREAARWSTGWVGTIVSNDAYAAPAVVAAQAAESRKLVHWMTGQYGWPVRATTLLFLPKGTPPAGGWPVVAWVHGTQTVGTGAPAAAACSSSESPTLDGNLTADGFTSHYADTVAALVGAGYAVVAPDLEGYGARAQADGTPAAYYNLASSGRSVAAALLAAHKVVGTLSSSWASVGHSEGGHAVLGLEASTHEAARYPYKGAVAVAPFSNVAASVEAVGPLITQDPANALNYRVYQENTVLMFTTSLNIQRPMWSPAAVSGPDLVALGPQARQLCSLPLFGAVAQAVATKGLDQFQGFKAGWNNDPTMKTFLRANDIAISPSFSVAKPTLVLQGSADPLVFEALQTPFMQRLKSAGMPVTYSVYAGADHASIMVDGRAEMLSFLKTLLP